MGSGLKVFHRGLILVGVPFILGLALITGLAFLLYESDQEQLQEATYRKIAAVNARLLILTSENPYYLVQSIRFSSDEIFQIYRNKRELVLKNQARLMELLKQTSDLADGSFEIQSSIDKIMGITDEIASARTAHLPELMSKMGKVIETYEKEKGLIMERLAKQLRSGEIRTLEMQKQQALIRFRQSQILSFGLLANLIAGIVLAIFFRRGIAFRLKTIKQNTIRLSNQEAMLPAIKGGDEIAQLDSAFHVMDQELKLAAKREQELFENASDVICVFDYSNKFIKVNLASQRNWGYSPEQLSLMQVDEIVHKDDMNIMLDHIAKGKLTGESFNFENRISKSDGSIIEASWSSFWSQKDRLLYCVVHDITERKRAERTKQKFLAMISNDLKRPLSAMSGAVAILLGSMADTLSANALEKLSIAGKNLQRLLGLVNDLLQVTEMEGSTIDIKKETCDTEEPLVRSLQEVEALADKQGIKLELHACQVQWTVDPNRIVQVLVNLLSNAIKFSPAGGIVTLSAEQKGDMIEVKVKDQGRGVPESHKEAIFEKFKQVEAADGKRKSGTGLGLPICKQIVEDHGGSIGVDSIPEQGSTFWFLIPRDETVSLKLKLEKRKAAEDDAKLQESARQTELTNLQTSQEKQSGIVKSGAAVFGRIKLGFKGAMLVGLPLIFSLFLAGNMSGILMQVDRERKQELHYRNIAFQTTRILNMYFMMIVGAIDNNTEKDWLLFLEGYNTGKETLDKLAVIVKNDPQGRQLVAAAREQSAIVDEWVEGLKAAMKKRNDFKGGMGGKEKLAPTIIKLAHKLERLCDESEKKELSSPAKLKTLRSRQYQLLGLALALNIAGSIALAMFFSRDIVSRLQILADNAMRLAKEKELNQQLSGSDEIAELDKTFHETALALSEARKKERAIFDNSQDLICSIDNEGLFRSANNAAEEMLAFERTELIGTALKNLVLQDDHEAMQGLHSIDAHEHLQMELRLKKKDGATIHTRWSYSRAAAGGDILCVVHDISNLKELEQIKSEFLAMVSHDLRTPLTAVLGIAKLILAGAFGKVDERPQRILNTITKSGEQLLELINDLLDIEKLEAGKMQLVLEEVKFIDLLKRAASASRDSERVVLDPDLDENESVRADSDRMVQALTNIFNNALDRSAQDTTIRISLESNAEELRLTVADNATTLSQELHSSLFDRFQLASDSNPTEGPNDVENTGAGLGLPIARKIIESHGGKIGSAPQEDGNIIWFQLPR